MTKQMAKKMTQRMESTGIFCTGSSLFPGQGQLVVGLVFVTGVETISLVTNSFSTAGLSPCPRPLGSILWLTDTTSLIYPVLVSRQSCPQCLSLSGFNILDKKHFLSNPPISVHCVMAPHYGDSILKFQLFFLVLALRLLEGRGRGFDANLKEILRTSSCEEYLTLH